MGQRYGCPRGALPVTEELSERVIRLPCYYGMSEKDQAAVVAAVTAFFPGNGSGRAGGPA
jgi:dTDP-4-amino-4,6-dideoxygalactose transaminase